MAREIMSYIIYNTQTREIYYEGVSREDCEYNMPKKNIYREGTDNNHILKPIYVILSDNDFKRVLWKQAGELNTNQLTTK